jgi:hypothetical protein
LQKNKDLDSLTLCQIPCECSQVFGISFTSAVALELEMSLGAGVGISLHRNGEMQGTV